MKKRVLLILDEAWNDKLYGNNNMSNWFTGFSDVELAVVYCSPELPDNQCCQRYFQVTDGMMLRSLTGRGKAGAVVTAVETPTPAKADSAEDTFGKIKKTHLEIFRLCRDLLWLWGRYDVAALKRFVEDFDPHVVFSQRKASVKLCRLECLIHQLTDAPMMVYTGDNEYSLAHLNFSPVFWVRHFMLRHAMRRNMKFYAKYYTASREQADGYHQKFGVPTDLLFKCGDDLPEKTHTEVHSPVRIVYAGKLYCGRWKTLAKLAQALSRINGDETKIVLDIYTRDSVTKRQKALLDDGKNVRLCGAVAPEALPGIYANADIALHVESFDLKNRWLTRHSYSTKVVDCLSCGCAAMAIGWEHHSACVELKNSDAAFVMTNPREMENVVRQIADDPSLVLRYAKKAMENIRQDHSREKVQDTLRKDFCDLSLQKRENLC